MNRSTYVNLDKKNLYLHCVPPRYSITIMNACIPTYIQDIKLHAHVGLHVEGNTKHRTMCYCNAKTNSELHLSICCVG